MPTLDRHRLVPFPDKALSTVHTGIVSNAAAVHARSKATIDSLLVYILNICRPESVHRLVSLPGAFCCTFSLLYLLNV